MTLSGLSVPQTLTSECVLLDTNRYLYYLTRPESTFHLLWLKQSTLSLVDVNSFMSTIHVLLYPRSNWTAYSYEKEEHSFERYVDQTIGHVKI